MNFQEKLNRAVAANNTLLSVGLDSNIKKLPKRFLEEQHPQFAFNKFIIDQTTDLVCAYKPNLAFYEACGAQGWQELAMTMEHLQANHPKIVTIADAKRGDIGSTNEAYAQAIFDELGFDAITLHPYLGQEALEPFLRRKDKACIFLCRTSNPGAGEFQDLPIAQEKNKQKQPPKLWRVVARKIVADWNQAGNCLLVVGATYPAELAAVRQLVGEMTLLVPGVGAQGGDVETVISHGANQAGRGLIINSSRSVIFADDPAQAAANLVEQMKL